MTYKVAVQRNKREEPNIPPLVVDPNEITKVLITLISLVISRFQHYGSLLKIETNVKEGNILCTHIASTDNVNDVAIPRKSVDELLGDGKVYSPYQFSLEVVREIVTSNYNGRLTFTDGEATSQLILEIPIVS